MYPGSPSPVSTRRSAGRHGKAGLGEAGYKGGRRVPGLAEPVSARRPAGHHGKAGLGEAGYRGGWRVPGLGEMLGWASRKGRPRGGRLQGGVSAQNKKAGVGRPF